MTTKLPNTPRTLRLNAKDNVIVAVDTVEAGAGPDGVTARARVMRGHKMATAPIATTARPDAVGRTRKRRQSKSAISNVLTLSDITRPSFIHRFG